MTPKSILRKLGIHTPEGLLKAAHLLWVVSGIAERLQAAALFEKIMARWDKERICETLVLRFRESADQDDRHSIQLTVFTPFYDDAEKAIRAIVTQRTGQVDFEFNQREARARWTPKEFPEPNKFRAVMDAVAVMEGHFCDTEITMVDIREWVKGVHTLAEQALPDKKSPKTAKDCKPHFGVGDILENSWGYNQTNWYFYQVLSVTSRFITYQRLAVNETPMDSSMRTKLSPVPGESYGSANSETARAKVKFSDRGAPYINCRFGIGTKWDGTTKTATHYA